MILADLVENIFTSTEFNSARNMSKKSPESRQTIHRFPVYFYFRRYFR